MKRLILLASFLTLTVVVVHVQAADSFSTVKHLAVSYVTADNKIKVRWDKKSAAREYKIKIYCQGELIQAVTTTKGSKKFPASLFENGETCSFQVRVRKTDRKLASDWKKKSFTYYVRPTIEADVDDTYLSGASMWLFAINDGHENPLMSGESNGRIVLGRLDMDQPAQIDFTPVLDSSDAGGESIADHWHIFAHGFHWIAFSTSSAETSYLAKINSDMEVVDIVRVAHEVSLSSKGGGPDMPTNDLFLVEEPGGVTVGHYYPNYGHRLYRFDTNLELQETVRIGGGDNVHSNGSSAIPVDDGFVVLATDTLHYLAYGEIQLMRFSADWELESSEELIAEPETNIAMGSGVFVNGDYLIVNARVVPNAAPEGETPTEGNGGGNDGGDVVQYVFGPDFTQISRTVLAEGQLNRPHINLIEDRLISTWDGSGGTLRIDRFNQ